MCEYKFSFNADDGDRLSIKIRIIECGDDPDYYELAFVIKQSEDHHNRKIENAILDYRLEHHPVTPDVVAPFNLKRIVFDDLKEESLKKLSLTDSKLKNLKVSLVTFVSIIREFYRHDQDYVKAIAEYNKKNPDNRILPPKECREEVKQLMSE